MVDAAIATPPPIPPLTVLYVLPFALYLLLVQIPGYFPDAYPWLYSLVVVITGGVTWMLLRGRQVLVPHMKVGAGVIVGIAGIAAWIGLSELNLEQHIAHYLPATLRPQPRAGFNPIREIHDPAFRVLFITARVVGLVLLVPVAEELFWRGFLLRWIISSDWQKVEIGTFAPASFVGVAVLFTLAHPEWLAAFVYCCLMNGLIYWKRELWNCVVAHSVSNLILGIYVLATGTWKLW